MKELLTVLLVCATFSVVASEQAEQVPSDKDFICEVIHLEITQLDRDINEAALLSAIHFRLGDMPEAYKYLSLESEYKKMQLDYGVTFKNNECNRNDYK